MLFLNTHCFHSVHPVTSVVIVWDIHVLCTQTFFFFLKLGVRTYVHPCPLLGPPSIKSVSSIVVLRLDCPPLLRHSLARIRLLTVSRWVIGVCLSDSCAVLVIYSS